MISAASHARSAPSVTNGAIAALNLESACRRAWRRYALDPGAPGVPEAIVDMERLKLQFFGDLSALERMETLASRLSRTDASFRSELVAAEVASAAHRFAQARSHIGRAAQAGAPGDAVERQLLAIDQACGVGLDRVLDVRCRIAAASGALEDLVPLGAMLADLECFEQAEAVHLRAFDTFDGTSPFPLAWVCFQLGMLWGELVPTPDLDVSAQWYELAIAYLPIYVKARVHLAEIYVNQDRANDAETLLRPALSSGDPEVAWRLADALTAQKRFEEAEAQRKVASSAYEGLLGKHLLAFADHGAEFYAGSGNNSRRALELARANVANRPTRRAVAQLNSIAKNTASA